MFNMKIIFIASFLVLIAAVSSRSAGSQSQLHGAEREEAVKVLNDTLSKLSAGDGQSFQASKVHSVTRQVVSGTLYRYKVDLSDESQNTETCNVVIWSQPWIEKGTEITIKCPGQPGIKARL